MEESSMSNEELCKMLYEKYGDMKPTLGMPTKDSEPMFFIGNGYYSYVYPDRIEIYSSGINVELVETIRINE